MRRVIQPRTSVLLFVVAACNSGEEPERYGEVCDPDLENQCGDGMECVDAVHHERDLAAHGYRCSVPCEVDADCPAAGVGCDAGKDDLVFPYPCYPDGYCEIWLCGD